MIFFYDGIFEKIQVGIFEGVGMEKFCYGIMIFFLVNYVVQGYQPLEYGSLIESLVSLTPKYLKKQPKPVFEKRSDGLASHVISVCGSEEFDHFVIETSLYQPVVVMVHADVNPKKHTMSTIVQDLADTFKDQVLFVSMWLFAQQNNEPGNYQIIGSLLQNYNIANVEMPLILFFKDGQLYTPEHEPSIILQGVYTKENLEVFIKNKFFKDPIQIMQNDATGLSFSPTTIENDRIKEQSILSKKENSVPWYVRLKNFFKNKKK